MIWNRSLTKVHYGQCVTVLNEAPHNEAIWRSIGTVPCVLKLGITWLWVVTFTMHHPLNRRLGEPPSYSGHCIRETSLVSFANQTNSLAIHPVAYSWQWLHYSGHCIRETSLAPAANQTNSLAIHPVAYSWQWLHYSWHCIRETSLVPAANQTNSLANHPVAYSWQWLHYAKSSS